MKSFSLFQGVPETKFLMCRGRVLVYSQSYQWNGSEQKPGLPLPGVVSGSVLKACGCETWGRGLAVNMVGLGWS